MSTTRTESEMIRKLLGSARRWLESEDRNAGVSMCLGDLDPLEIYRQRLGEMSPRKLRREYNEYVEEPEDEEPEDEEPEDEELEDEEDTE